MQKTVCLTVFMAITLATFGKQSSALAGSQSFATAHLTSTSVCEVSIRLERQPKVSIYQAIVNNYGRMDRHGRRAMLEKALSVTKEKCTQTRVNEDYPEFDLSSYPLPLQANDILFVEASRAWININCGGLFQKGDRWDDTKPQSVESICRTLGYP